MLLFLALISLLLTLPVSANYHPRCLSADQLSCIADDWLKVRSLTSKDPSFAGLLRKTVTVDSTYEDETISYFIGGIGLVGPYTTNRQQYLQSRINGETISTTTPPAFTLEDGVAARFSCDSITLRWVSSATVNLISPFSSDKIGDPVVYKGIDLLILDVDKGKIKNVYTSADYIREIKQKGFPLS